MDLQTIFERKLQAQDKQMAKKSAAKAKSAGKTSKVAKKANKAKSVAGNRSWLNNTNSDSVRVYESSLGALILEANVGGASFELYATKSTDEECVTADRLADALIEFVHLVEQKHKAKGE